MTLRLFHSLSRALVSDLRAWEIENILSADKVLMLI